MKKGILKRVLVGCMAVMLFLSTFTSNVYAGNNLENQDINLNSNIEREISKELKQYLVNYYKDVYSFSEFSFSFEKVEGEDTGLVVDTIVEADMALSRNPEDSPFVMGMMSVKEDCANDSEKQIVQDVINTYLSDVMACYQVPYETTFLYRIKIDEDGGLQIFKCLYNGEDEYTYEKLSEDEKFVDIFTFDDGIKYVSDKISENRLSRAAVTVSGYNASSAVSYAIKHATDKPEFNSADGTGSDCANFVSKCIYAGGIAKDVSGGWYPASTWGAFGTAGINWIRTGYNNNGGVIPYFWNKGYIRSVSQANVSKGCIMYWNTTSHVAIVTYCDGSTIKYSHHSSSKKSNVYYEYKSEDVTFYKFV